MTLIPSHKGSREHLMVILTFGQAERGRFRHSIYRVRGDTIFGDVPRKRHAQRMILLRTAPGTTTAAGLTREAGQSRHELALTLSAAPRYNRQQNQFGRK